MTEYTFAGIGYIDEIRKDTVIIRNAGGYFGTIPSEVITGELPSAQPELEEDCDTCKHGYFGGSQCNNCRMRFPSHYEREEEQHEET